MGLSQAVEIVGGWMRDLEQGWTEGGKAHGPDRGLHAPGRSRSFRAHHAIGCDHGAAFERRAYGPDDASNPAEPAAIIRDDLGRTQPASADGQELGLWHYTIPPG